MRRAIIVIVALLILSVTVIIVIDLRVKGKIILPQEAAEMAATPPAPSNETKPDTIPDAKTPPPPPPPAADGTPTPSEPPEGWIWWGCIAFHKDAKIQSNYREDHPEICIGYEVPIQYTNDGTLIVASKYRDHTACIWSYDTASGRFAIKHTKTRNAVRNFKDLQGVFAWTEEPRGYTCENDPKTGKMYRKCLENPLVSRGPYYGDTNSDECYNRKPYLQDVTGFIFKSDNVQLLPVPLNHGALELIETRNYSHMTIPFTEIRFAPRHHTDMAIYDPVAKRELSSISADAVGPPDGFWDFGQGLAISFYSKQDQRAVLLGYPDLRVLARGDGLPRLNLQLMPSTKTKLALDVVPLGPVNWIEKEPLPQGSACSKVYRVRVPNNWRRAPGQKNMACVWEDPPKNLATLEVTEEGSFDLAKYDAHWLSNAEGDPCPRNLQPSYEYRDGVMYWRKRHTGEVVMASLSDLDTQTIIGGAGTTWDGFRVNPVRDEMVTWRENGELVFWNVQFPTAEPLYRARVITDETPHRLEAM